MALAPPRSRSEACSSETMSDEDAERLRLTSEMQRGLRQLAAECPACWRASFDSEEQISCHRSTA